MRKIVLDGILGLCVGDACGVPVEGSQRIERDIKPVKDMIGYGTYFQPPGTWSDGTSMTLATLDSLCNGLDYDDLMQKFIAWYEDAKYTAYDEVFDIGNVTRKALRNYDGTKAAFECGGTRERDNGNGSLMRILPIIYYLRGRYTDGSYLTNEGYEIVHKLSSMTHAHPISQIACGLYVSMAIFYLDVSMAQNEQESIRAAFRYYRKNPQFRGWIERFQCIEDLQEVISLRRENVRNSGYVVDTLEAALWSFLTTDNYQECILKAVNLGGDSDTVAAIAGGLAGLKYGLEQIPKKWLSQIAKKKEILIICNSMQKRLLKSEMAVFENSIDYLRAKVGENVCHWHSGEAVSENVFHYSYAIYEQPVYDLMENILPHSLFMSGNYQEVIRKSGYKSAEEAAEEIENADMELCSAVLTDFVRRERLTQGYWNHVVENGDLYRALIRLKHLV